MSSSLQHLVPTRRLAAEDRGSTTSHRLLSAATQLLLYGGLLWLLSPAVVNGDGAGYLRQATDGGLAAGHPAYLPLARLLATWWSINVPLDLAAPLRLLSLGCSLVTLVLLHDAARLLLGPRRALVCAGLLALSHAFTRSAVQVEVYACAGMLSMATLWSLVRYRCCPDRRTTAILWAALAGLLAGLAVQLHLTLGLLSIPLVVLPRYWGGRGWWQASLAGGIVMTLTTLLLLVLALHNQGLTTLADSWSWLRGSDHGLPDPHGWSAPLVAGWGLARSLVFVPYPYSASWPVVAVATSVSGGLLAGLSLLARRASKSEGEGLGLEVWALVIWALPLACFAALFYPSDTERWIFALPALVLFLGRGPLRTLRLALVIMLLVNLGVALLPGALDDTQLRRARAVEQLVRGDSLLVSPGHGWEELVGLGTPAPPQSFPLVYYAGAHRGLAPAVTELHHQVSRSLAAGKRVFVARLHDATDPRGFKELAWLGMSRAQFAALFQGYRRRPTEISGLWELSIR
jgi:hypothetical protein